MGLRYKGGLLSVNAPTISQARAPGVWSQSDVTIARAANTWPISGIDPYFENTTLLLHGDQTSNFLTDLSPNNFFASTNGNPQSSQFTPFFGDGYYSNFFNGSTDYLSLTNAAAFNLSTGAFTIELFANRIGDSSGGVATDYESLIGSNNGGSADWNVYYQRSTQKIVFYAAGTLIPQTSGTFTSNQWAHIAIVRDGSSNLAMFINGIRVLLTTSSAALGVNASGLKIANDNASNRVFYGNLSNISVVKGTAVYSPSSTTITVPTAPLTAIANTSLLTCGYNRFKDGSSNNFTITTSGTPKVVSVSPFANPSTGGSGAGYFNGSTDGLYNTSGAAVGNFGTSDFTIETFLYINAAISSPEWQIFENQPTTGSFQLYKAATTNNFCYGTYGVGGNVILSPANIPLFQWFHVAVCRSGSGTNNVSTYINGVRVAQFTDNNNYSTTGFSIGARNNGTVPFPGYISNLRTVKGTALYSGTTITVPTTTLTPVSGTSLLTLTSSNAQNNNIFQDSSQNYAVITRSGTPTQGALNPFGNLWSNYFDGSSSIVTPSSGQFAPAGAFTVSFWYCPNTISAQVLIGNYTSGLSTNWDIEITAAGRMDVYTNGSTVRISSATGAIVAGQWYFISLVRDSSNVITLRINGASQGTFTQSGTFGTATLPIYIGANSSGTAKSNCYLSNVFLNDGNAITTVPTVPTTAVSGTVLLTCQSNRFIDNSLVPQTLTLSGTPKVQPFSPFAPPLPYSTTVYGGSGYFAGTTDYLRLASSTLWNFGTGDFTVEFNVYAISSATASTETYYPFLGTDGSFTAGSLYNWLIQYVNQGGLNKLRFARKTTTTGGASDVNIDSNVFTLPLNQWSHFAIVRASGVIYFYLNGVSIGSGAYSGDISSTQGLVINASFGGATAQSVSWVPNGYTTNLRIVKGLAVYSGTSTGAANFVVPTGPLSATQSANPFGGSNTAAINASQTVLLTGMTNGAIIDNTAKNDLITVGSTRISTAVKQFGPSSIALNGTTDYLQFLPPANANGSGLFYAGASFTIEGWVYITSYQTTATYYNTVLADASGSSGTTMAWSVGTDSSNKPSIAWYDGTAKSAIGSTALPTSTWTYIAFVCNNGVVSIYVNGLSQGLIGTTTITTPNQTTGNLVIGVDRQKYWAGNLDDLRVTKGIARYTGPTCPVPAVAFPNQ